MLVLSRKKDEKLVIGDEIVITVVEIRGDTVKLGISAPKDVPIYRSELIEAIKEANVEASSAPVVDLGELQRKFLANPEKSDESEK
jgi:carbon storage regulator